MKSKFIALAVLASASLCLAGCGTTQSQVDSAVTSAQAVLLAAKSTVDADAKAGVIDAATAKKIDGYISAGDLAMSAAQAAYAAGDATTEQAKVADVLTAVAEINAAVLSAVQTYSTK